MVSMNKRSDYAKKNMFHCSLRAFPVATHASMSFIKEEADAVLDYEARLSFHNMKGITLLLPAEVRFPEIAFAESM